MPITTHTHAAHAGAASTSSGYSSEEGVDLTRVVIGHSGDTTDLDYLEELIDTGSYIGMDRFGIDVLPADRGARRHGRRRCASAATPTDGAVARRVAASSTGFAGRGHPPRRMPNWHYPHIHDDVLPALRERGVDRGQIDQMLVDNPRRMLSGEG